MIKKVLITPYTSFETSLNFPQNHSYVKVEKTAPLFFQNLHLERYISFKTSAISNIIRTLKIEKMISIASFSKTIHILKRPKKTTPPTLSP